jgi:hypothetical protein
MEIFMNNFTDVKLEIFIPQGHVEKVRDALAEVGVGVIRNYDHCFAISQVQGSFRPLEGENPFDGEIGVIKETVEYKMEVNCESELVKSALEMIKLVHPYEEPLINVIPLANHLFRGA